MNEQKIQPKKIVLGIPHTGTLYTEVVSSLFIKRKFSRSGIK